jgi:TolB-like protein
VEIAFAILHREPGPLPPTTPARIARLVSRCLEKNPANRYTTARELASALRECLESASAEPSIQQRTATLKRVAAAIPPVSSAAASGAGLTLTFLAEMKRRRVFRVLVGYGIAAFAVLQVIEPIMHGLHWPEVVLSYVVVSLAAGFPIAVMLSWAFDLNAGRIERTAPLAASSPKALRGVRLGLLLTGIGVLAAAPGLAWHFLRSGAPAGSEKPGANADRTIAVLPLASIGEESGYFAQGIHDELLRQLASVGGLEVISRTSVLQYKDGARNVREIGEALGAASIVEGSVQRAGNRVRVEAKLIDARRDRQIWADRYDRDVTDLFALQTAIAEEIATALLARLSPAQKARTNYWFADTRTPAGPSSAR